MIKERGEKVDDEERGEGAEGIRKRIFFCHEKPIEKKFPC
jgi:hypothetical protein